MHTADGTGAFYIEPVLTCLTEVQIAKQTTDLLADFDVAKNNKSFLLNSFKQVFYTILGCWYMLKENITDLTN